MGDRLAKRRVEKWGEAAVPLMVGAAGSPSNTIMWIRPRTTSVLSGVLIHLIVWPQYINFMDRQDRENNGTVA